jgi:hypothetical protein
MADTRCQLECEDWVRQDWMPQRFGQKFHRDRMRLTSGGMFDFDAVSADGTTIATISTSGAKMRGGKQAGGKLMKLRSDMLFLLLAAPKRAAMILTERDMYELCEKEKVDGRAPRNIEFYHAPLPPDLAAKLKIAKQVSSEEVSPRRGVTSGEAVVE